MAARSSDTGASPPDASQPEENRYGFRHLGYEISGLKAAIPVTGPAPEAISGQFGLGSAMPAEIW